MESAIDYLLKSAGVLSIFVLVYHFLLRRLTFFNANRWFLLLGIAASILFPLVEITQTVYVQQQQQLTYVPQSITTNIAVILQEPPVAIEIVDYGMLAGYLYLAIALFFLGKMLVELSSLRSLIKAGNKTRSAKFMMVTLSRKLTPFSFFNYICYSQEDQNTPELDLILDHEKVHAREWHSIDLLLSHVFKALFWINPLVWVLKRQIGENLEFIADSKAATQNTSGMSYERTLLSAVASYKQPALANNFFTPFIKNRIVMLQKEASATWNVYKYALILPVIVIFLYSFNVVEEIEYVENTKKRMVHQKDDKFEELVFDITSKTNDQQLEKYRKLIESKMDYQLRFDDLDRDVNSLLKKISVSAKFPDREWEKGFTVSLTDKDLLLLMAYPDKIAVHIPEIKTTLSIDRNGNKVSVLDEILAGKASTAKEEDANIILPLEHLITFRIDAKTTEADLKREQEFFKKQYNVDFIYSKFKITKGRIVKIKISLNDNKGYQASSTCSNKDGISSICVKGVMDGESKSWSMKNCDAQLSNVSYTVTGPSYPHQVRSGKFDLISMDSLSEIVRDEIRKVRADSLSIMEIDSLTARAESIQFNNPVTKYTFKNGVSSRVSSNIQLKSISFDEDPTLIIVDGKAVDAKFAQLIDPDRIETMTVLKDSTATNTYGDRGKDGVIILTTNLTKQQELKKRRIYTQGKRASMDSLKQRMYLRRDSLKTRYVERRVSLEGKRTEKKEERRVLMEERRALMEEKRAQVESDREEATAQRFESGTSDFLMQHKGHGRLALDDKEIFYITNTSKESFEKFQKQLEEAGHTFKLMTHRMKKDRLIKLKYEINGVQHTYQTNKGVKILEIQFIEGNTSPSISMIPYQ
jgi:hypothetical protein